MRNHPKSWNKFREFLYWFESIKDLLKLIWKLIDFKNLSNFRIFLNLRLNQAFSLVFTIKAWSDNGTKRPGVLSRIINCLFDYCMEI